MDNIKMIKLSSICSLITKGTTPTTLGYEFQNSGVNFLKIECFDEMGNFMPEKLCYISNECNEKLKRSQLKENDIVFSIAGALGRVAIIDKTMLPANINQALAIIRIEDEDIYIPYIKLILSSNIIKQQLEKQKQGVAQLNLSLKNIGNLLIPICENKTQIELVSIFEKIQISISKRKLQLEQLDLLVKSRFVEMFGDVISNEKKWNMRIWNDVLSIKNGRNQKTVENINGKYAICGSGGIMGYATDYITEANSVIIGRKGNINKPILMRERFWNVDTAFGLEPNQSINVEYLYMFCLLFDFDRLNKAVTIPSLTKADLLNIKMPIPPIELQNEFAQFVEQVEKTKAQVQKSLDEAQLLFNSLMQEYFG